MRFPRPVAGWIRALSRGGAMAVVLALVSAGLAHAATVSVFPIPGSRVAAPGAQIVFRGVSVRHVGPVTVTGSRSGRHSGRLVGDSDNDGASFIPRTAFTPGEQVTVRTRLSVLNGRRGTFSFTVAQPAGSIDGMYVHNNRRRPDDVVTFHSRPDLVPARIDVLRNTSSSAGGDIFLGPQVGPVQNGPMIIDPTGHLVWFAPVRAGSEANNVRVQSYRGRPVITWWQGNLDLRNGVGTGEDVIDNSSYQRITTVRAADGLATDLHEFQITPAGTALITAYFPVYWDLRSVHSTAHAEVLDAVIQEIDIKTGLLLFQWDSLDHVAPSASEIGHPQPSNYYDYFHINSIHLDSDGTIVASGRNTWAAYKISHLDGHVIWTLGGKHSDFTMGPGASFAFQHDVRISGPGDSLLTVFDDGAGPPSVHNQSRALVLRLDTVHHTATVAAAYTHSPALLSQFEGDMETLTDGDEFVGWGEQPFFTEFSPAGQMVFDARFAQANTTYRALRFPWVGTPHTRPAVAMSVRGRVSTVYASWNGATQVSAWRVLSGASSKSLRVAGTFARTGFETTMSVARRSYVQVQALGAAGHVLGTSSAVKAG